MRASSYPFGTGKHIATVEYGDPVTAVTTVVFIHGWLDNAASFYSLMEKLHQRAPELHLLALDLPGHGHSSHKDPDNFYPFHDYIDDLYRLLLNLSASKTVLVGHSLGALIASCYSAAFPEKVAALVQIEGAGPLAEDGHKATTRLRQGIKSRARMRKKVVRDLANMEQALTLRSISSGLAAEIIRPIVERDTRYNQKTQAWQWRHDPKLKCDSLYRMTQLQAATLLGDVQCPHQIILGDQGFKYLKTQTNNSATSYTVKGGHHCHLDSPQAVAETILDLVNKI